jgi:enamine deaminase RidA (YjgF/YER057c/UK114 family)
MTIECINPEDLPVPLTYTQVVVATGTRLVFVAGQEPEDREGDLVGPGNLALQAHQVFANLGRALVAGGARPAYRQKLARSGRACTRLYSLGERAHPSSVA